ncbi:MAG: hypothetical protein EZS28_048221, partial [Streblomastix strix]
NEAKQSFAVGGDYYEPVSSADSSLVVEDLIVVGVEELLVSDFTVWNEYIGLLIVLSFDLQEITGGYIGGGGMGLFDCIDEVEDKGESVDGDY